MDFFETLWREGHVGIFRFDKLLFAVGVLAFFIIFQQLLARALTAIVKAWTKVTSPELSAEIHTALIPPFKLFFVTLGIAFGAQILELPHSLEFVCRNLIITLICFSFFWLMVRLVDPFKFVLEHLAFGLNKTIVQWMEKGLKLLFTFTGAAAILEIWGVHVGPIIAGLGLFGVAVALGAQDLFKNLLDGLIIIAEKRFSPGDSIRVDGVVEGTVEDIGFRSTKIRNLERAPVYVPNADLADKPVINLSALSYRRIYWKVRIDYRTNLQQLRQIRDEVRNYILEHDEFARPEELVSTVRIDSLNESSIDMVIECFTRATNNQEYFEIKERLAFKVKDVIETVGAGFAFPSRSVYVESIAQPKPEAFAPPGAPAPSKTT